MAPTSKHKAVMWRRVRGGNGGYGALGERERWFYEVWVQYLYVEHSRMSIQMLPIARYQERIYVFQKNSKSVFTVCFTIILKHSSKAKRKLNRTPDIGDNIPLIPSLGQKMPLACRAFCQRTRNCSTRYQTKEGRGGREERRKKQVENSLPRISSSDQLLPGDSKSVARSKVPHDDSNCNPPRVLAVCRRMYLISSALVGFLDRKRKRNALPRRREVLLRIRNPRGYFAVVFGIIWCVRAARFGLHTRGFGTRYPSS